MKKQTNFVVTKKEEAEGIFTVGSQYQKLSDESKKKALNLISNWVFSEYKQFIPKSKLEMIKNIVEKNNKTRIFKK